ncbi:alpha/beta hydrolase [Pseudomonas sp. R5(2019)]|uniref:alpha/beta hydrolase n=1 Tax=Pseudomonas sp. R5(2019) TaxID=2697566 RepID=UPI001411B905|nr:alpha/beta fold hydrolase [Pseudomonas sp. R5(2019)]NBA97294.1 alpha/beta fold hydrolase [Pseudomonas sp. R5(2019)]
MMLRFFALVLLFCSSLLQAAPSVLQRPITLDTGSGMLAGTLLLPRSDKPVPVVLLIAGSGPTDRDGNNALGGGRNDSLKRLALLLANNGIASVRYDKRGIAASRAAGPDERFLSVEGYVADAVAWGKKLHTDPRLGPLILLGHSEGALIASLAAESAGAQAVISLSGSGRPIDAVLREQLHDRLPHPLLKRSEQLIDSLKAGWVDTHVPDDLQVIFRPSVQPYLISLFRQDPAAAFARLQMPALIVQGRNDIQVSVDDAERLKAAKPDAQLVLVDGMNHVLRIVPEDLQSQLDSYKNPNLPLASILAQSLVSFIEALPKK